MSNQELFAPQPVEWDQQQIQPNSNNRRLSLATEAVHTNSMRESFIRNQNSEYNLLNSQREAMEEMLLEGKQIIPKCTVNHELGKVSPFCLDMWRNAVKESRVYLEPPHQRDRSQSAILNYADQNGRKSLVPIGLNQKKSISQSVEQCESDNKIEPLPSIAVPSQDINLLAANPNEKEKPENVTTHKYMSAREKRRGLIKTFLPGATENEKLCQQLGISRFGPQVHLNRVPIYRPNKLKGLPERKLKVSHHENAKDLEGYHFCKAGMNELENEKKRIYSKSNDLHALGGVRLAPVDYSVLLNDQKKMMEKVDQSHVEYSKLVQLVEDREHDVHRRFSAFLKMDTHYS